MGLLNLASCGMRTIQMGELSSHFKHTIKLIRFPQSVGDSIFRRDLKRIGKAKKTPNRLSNVYLCIFLGFSGRHVLKKHKVWMFICFKDDILGSSYLLSLMIMMDYEDVDEDNED